MDSELFEPEDHVARRRRCHRATRTRQSDFLEPYWQRTAYALARDNFGMYYYVDRLMTQAGGNDYRLTWANAAT